MKRKTVEVQTVMGIYKRACVSRPDDFCAGISTPEVEIERLNASLRGMTMMIDSILSSTGNYKGFSYIDRDNKLCGLDHPEFCEYRRVYVGF